MKRRETPREHPQAWPFIKHTDEVCDWIRVPSPGEAQDILEGIDFEDKSARSVEAQLGGFVLAGWCSTTHDLEGTTPRAVYREMHDAGWHMDRIAALALDIMNAIKGEVVGDDEVHKAADFTSADQPTS